jgi:hypothetical protein
MNKLSRFLGIRTDGYTPIGLSASEDRANRRAAFFKGMAIGLRERAKDLVAWQWDGAKAWLGLAIKAIRHLKVSASEVNGDLKSTAGETAAKISALRNKYFPPTTTIVVDPSAEPVGYKPDDNGHDATNNSFLRQPTGPSYQPPNWRGWRETPRPGPGTPTYEGG